MTTTRIDGVTYATRRFETGSELWGGYTALRIGTTWRFLVTIRGVNCVVIVTGTGFSMACSIRPGEDVRPLDSAAFGSPFARAIRASEGRHNTETPEAMVLRLLRAADEAIAARDYMTQTKE